MNQGVYWPFEGHGTEGESHCGAGGEPATSSKSEIELRPGWPKGTYRAQAAANRAAAVRAKKPSYTVPYKTEGGKDTEKEMWLATGKMPALMKKSMDKIDGNRAKERPSAVAEGVCGGRARRPAKCQSFLRCLRWTEPMRHDFGTASVRPEDRRLAYGGASNARSGLTMYCISGHQKEVDTRSGHQKEVSGRQNPEPEKEVVPGRDPG